VGCKRADHIRPRSAQDIQRHFTALDNVSIEPPPERRCFVGECGSENRLREVLIGMEEPIPGHCRPWDRLRALRGPEAPVSALHAMVFQEPTAALLIRVHDRSTSWMSPG